MGTFWLIPSAHFSYPCSSAMKRYFMVWLVPLYEETFGEPVGPVARLPISASGCLRSHIINLFKYKCLITVQLIYDMTLSPPNAMSYTNCYIQDMNISEYIVPHSVKPTRERC